MSKLELAGKLDAILQSFDPYEYQDTNYNIETAIEELKDPYAVVNMLLDIIDELTE